MRETSVVTPTTAPGPEMTPGKPSTQPIDNQIRRLRFEHGEITQEALANAVGITRQTVIALEAARYAPSLELAMRIAEVFGKRVDEVFFRRATA